MNFINGIGGVFIFSEDPKSLAKWYSENLNIEFEGDENFGAFYKVYYSTDEKDHNKKLDTSFSIIKSKVPTKKQFEETDSLIYGDQQFMVNFRVNNLDEIINFLEKRNIKIIKKQEEDYGKFAWIRDLEGNKIELYESKN